MAATDMTRGLITIALGSPTYIAMAKDLALSARKHCPHLPRAVVTDSVDVELRAVFDTVIQVDSSLGDGLFQKLWLDHYAPYDETLFVDCDCLLVNDVDFIFAACGDRDVGFVGVKKTDGIWYGADIAAVCAACQLPWLATLNSGMLFVRKSERAAGIFHVAREAMSRYQELGFEPFRETRADEVGFALTFSQHQVEPIDDPNWRTMYTPIGIEGTMQIDVLDGYCRFRKAGVEVEPTIVHFATWQYHPVYYRERAKLRLYYMNFAARALARPWASLIYWRERWLKARRDRSCKRGSAEV